MEKLFIFFQLNFTVLKLEWKFVDKFLESFFAVRKVPHKSSFRHSVITDTFLLRWPSVPFEIRDYLILHGNKMHAYMCWYWYIAKKSNYRKKYYVNLSGWWRLGLVRILCNKVSKLRSKFMDWSFSIRKLILLGIFHVKNRKIYQEIMIHQLSTLSSILSWILLRNIL